MNCVIDPSSRQQSKLVSAVKPMEFNMTAFRLAYQTPTTSTLPQKKYFVRSLWQAAAAATLLSAAVLTPLSYAFAQQSKSELNFETAVITNAAVLGSKANQTLEIANASKGSTTSTTIKTGVFTNAGVLGSKANQTAKIGNANDDSKSTVKVDTLVMTNAAVLGSKANQTLELGNATKGSTAVVSIKTLVMTNGAVLGSKSNQTVRMGNAN